MIILQMIILNRVGIYLRISQEDNLDESISITNQREYLLSYIKEKKDLIYCKEYIDDGYSGGNFERPGFKQMLFDIELKVIDCILVKDQSRFGRNDLVPYYINQYFPLKEVRFIAINSNIDTFDDNCYGNKMISLNSALNTHYCLDISEKVKSILYAKKREGKHLGGTAIYGYQKDPYDKYKIIIDEKIAPIIKKIYSLFINGYSLKMIAEYLDSNNIPIPSVYKNLNRGIISKMYGHWQTKTIEDILKNEMYIGNMCQSVHKRIAVNVKKIVKNPKEKWIIVENTHEPIIDKETFNIVQKMFKKNSHMTKSNRNNLLKGFIFCKECQHTIGINRVKEKSYLVCNYYRKYSKYNVCTPHYMKYKDLETVVLNNLKNHLKNIESSKLIPIIKNNNKYEKKLKLIELENNKIKKELINTNKKIEEVYEDKLNGIITTEMFNNINQKINKDKKQNLITIKDNQIIINNIKEKLEKENYEQVITDFLDLKHLNRKIISNLINKIEIDRNLNITIFYNFSKCHFIQ